MTIRLVFIFLLNSIISSALAAQAPWVGASLDGVPCNGGTQGYGPYDYTQRGIINPYHLRIVEDAHFVPKVENLISGNRGTLEGDLNYTLRAWPNHHRALVSVIKYQLNIRKKLRSDFIKVPPECYLQRAINFSPNDAMSYSLFGYYLRKLGRLQDSVKYFEKAITLEPKNAKIAYTFSLLLIDLHRYEEAVKYAQVVYENAKAKAPVELKHKLMKLGVWKE